MKDKKSVPYKILFLVIILIFLALSFYKFVLMKNEGKSEEENDRIFGLTIDDTWYDDIELEDVVEGLKNLEIRPMVRIVMSDETEPKDYIKLFQAVGKYADIMACPVDSFEMKNYKDTESYLKRFEDSYESLSSYVNLWEVGNEINGVEWIKQEPETIINKISSAADFIKSKNQKIALTLYCTDSPREDMIEWAEKYIPKELTETVDYCFVSYYEDDNENYLPEWKSIFEELGTIFPKAFLGIGECGNTAENATQDSKIAMAEKYYLMPKYHERFVGGYFWWNWVADCIPYKDNRVYESIKSCGHR